MKSKLNAIYATLKDNGLKNTRHRVQILELLESSKVPLSADDLYDKIRKSDLLLSISTVYRTLDTLLEKGVLNKISFEVENKTKYEINRDQHHHYFVCLSCNKVIPLEHCPVEEALEHVDSQEGFEIVSHRLEYYGYCRQCKNKPHHS